MLLTPDSEASGAVADSAFPYMYAQGSTHMWMGQGQQVRGLGQGKWLHPCDCSGQPLTCLLFTEAGFLFIPTPVLQTLSFLKLESLASSRG